MSSKAPQVGEGFRACPLVGCFCDMAMLATPSQQVITYMKNLAHEFRTIFL